MSHKHDLYQGHYHSRHGLESWIKTFMFKRIRRLLTPENVLFLVLSLVLFILLTVIGLVEIYRNIPVLNWFTTAWDSLQGASIAGAGDFILGWLTDITLGSVVALAGQVLRFVLVIIVALGNILVGFALLGAAVFFRLASTATGKILSWALLSASSIAAFWNHF